MGYYSDVRVVTTKEGWNKAHKLAKEIYETAVAKILDKAAETKPCDWDDDPDTISYRPKADEPHWVSCRTKLPEDVFELMGIAERTNGKETTQYVMYGFNSLKWLGYNHSERQAWEQAWEEIDEPVHVYMIGEDGQSDEQCFGDEDYSMPWVEHIGFTYSEEWKMY